MSRTTERARSSFYRAGGMPRVASMIALLVVIGVLIGRSADPSSWKWLAEERAGREGEAPAEPSINSKARQEPRPPEKVTPGPTEADSEERGAAAEEFQALTDGTLGMSKEEMPAYWRLFSWVEHQSLADLASRSDKTAVLNQFIQRPDDQRGKLFQIDLNVRRVMSYDAPPNSAGIEKVYEVTGWTTESKAWLYVVLTAHLPEGMPVGTDVTERVSFAGYFLKLQGYHEAGAKPRDKPLAAPLLVGRMSWQPRPVVRQTAIYDGFWGYWPAAIAFLVCVGFVLSWALGPRRDGPRAVAGSARLEGSNDRPLQDWLARAERGQMNGTAGQTDVRFHDN